MNAFTKNLITLLASGLALTATVSTGNAALPDPGMAIVKGRTALVVTDPQHPANLHQQRAHRWFR